MLFNDDIPTGSIKKRKILTIFVIKGNFTSKNGHFYDTIIQQTADQGNDIFWIIIASITTGRVVHQEYEKKNVKNTYYDFQLSFGTIFLIFGHQMVFTVSIKT